LSPSLLLSLPLSLSFVFLSVSLGIVVTSRCSPFPGGAVVAVDHCHHQHHNHCSARSGGGRWHSQWSCNISGTYNKSRTKLVERKIKIEPEKTYMRPTSSFSSLRPSCPHLPFVVHHSPLHSSPLSLLVCC
jgi:hypothetical protein